MDEENRISLPQAAQRLGVHYMTAYRYVRTGQLPAIREGAKWSVDVADLGLARSSQDVTPPARHPPVERASRLVDRLVAGDGAGAWTIVEGAMSSGSDPATIYLELLTPALEAIGSGWSKGKVSIAQEHRASVVAAQIVGRLGPRFFRRGRSRGSVVIGLAPGEQHTLTATMFADLVRHAGFEPLNLGANTPSRSFVEAALGADRLIAVLVGATSNKHDETVRDVIRTLHGASVSVPILVGGRAIRDQAHAKHLGADDWTGHDAVTALAVLNDLAARGQKVNEADHPIPLVGTS
jgi:excisionase family DNA binding protein